MLLRYRWPIATAALTAVLLSGCAGDEISSVVPEEGNSRIVGFVRGGDGPVPAQVGAELAGPPGRLRVSATALADSSGWYEMQVPPGRYVVSSAGVRWVLYHGPSGLVDSRAEADTLLVDRDTVRVDFEAGGLAVELQTPPELEGTRLELKAWRASENGPGLDGVALVSQNRAECHFPMVLPGEYIVRVKYSQPIQGYWLPDSYQREDADPVTVVTGRTASHEWSLPAPAHISGTVDGAWQALGGDRPQISAYADTVQVLSRAWADRWGRYDLLLPLPVSVRLRVDNGGVARWIGGANYDSATTYAVTQGQVVDGVNLRESGISCSIDLSGVSLFAGLVMTLMDEQGRAASGPVHWMGGPAPSIPNLVPGTYSLQVERWEGLGAQSWLPQWYDRRDSLRMADPITISTEGEVVQVNVRLIEGGKILGRVVPGEDPPPADPWIVLTSAADSSTAVPIVIAFATDRFEAMGLADGDYKIGVAFHPAGGQGGPLDPVTIWWPEAASWGAAQIVPIRDHARVAGIELHLP
jgi:hypothetical protein